MLKVWNRCLQVVARITHPWAHVRSRTQKALAVILTTASLLGFGAVTLTVDRVKAWVGAGHTHQALAAAAVLLFLVLLALYGAVKELDEMKFVQVRAGKTATAEVWPIVRSQGEHGIVYHNALSFHVSLSFRNDSEKPTRAYFPKLELLRREGRRWKSLDVTELYPWTLIQAHRRGLQDQRGFWSQDGRHEIPAYDEVIAELSRLCTRPQEEGIEAFLKKNLKIRLTIDVIGQPRLILDIALPRIEAPRE